MTNEEALKILERKMTKLINQINVEKDMECFAMAHYALEKQIPKEPIADIEGPFGVGYHCQECHKFVCENSYNYCPNCGQAIRSDNK